MRSNAKRHLRTHGIFPTSDHSSTSQSQFTVGFDTPLVSDVHEVGKLPSKLRWIPQSLSTRTNVDYLRDAPSDSEEEYLRPSCPMLPVPLPAVRPSSPTWNPDDNYEERDSFADAETSPYLPSQVRARTTCFPDIATYLLLLVARSARSCHRVLQQHLNSVYAPSHHIHLASRPARIHRLLLYFPPSIASGRNDTTLRTFLYGKAWAVSTYILSQVHLKMICCWFVVVPLVMTNIIDNALVPVKRR